MEIVQKDPSPGTNQVRVQVFRPDPSGQRLLVREGSVLVTWTAPSLGIRQFGPASVAVGQDVTYRVEVSNPGDLPARDIVASEEVPEGLSFLQANPAPVVEGRRLQWRLGNLAPRQQQFIEATFRTTRPGAVAHCVEVTGAGGLRSSHCANTNVQAALPGPVITPPPNTIPPPGSGTPRPGPGPTPTVTADLDIKVTTPESRVAVGSNVTFNVVLSNRGLATATGILLRDTFDDGLEYSQTSPMQRSPITRPVNDLAPGRSASLAVTFRVTRPGQLCQQVEATAAGGVHASTKVCVTAVAAAGNPGPATATPSLGGPTITPPPGTPAVTRPPSMPPVPPEIRVSGPTTSTVGKPVVFAAEIANVGRQPLRNVVVTQSADAPLVAIQASGGAVRKGNDLVWSLPSLEPGQPIRLQVQCDCKQATPKAVCRFTITPADGNPIESPAYLKIDPAPSPAGPTIAPSPTGPVLPPSPAAPSGHLEVFVDSFNKVFAGADQRFLIQVSNLGDSTDADIVVTARLPLGSTVVDTGTDGPTDNVRFVKELGLIRFSPVSTLTPKATITYRVVVTTSSPGPISLKVEATSRQQTTPALGEKTVNVLPSP